MQARQMVARRMGQKRQARQCGAVRGAANLLWNSWPWMDRLTKKMGLMTKMKRLSTERRRKRQAVARVKWRNQKGKMKIPKTMTVTRRQMYLRTMRTKRMMMRRRRKRKKKTSDLKSVTFPYYHPCWTFSRLFFLYVHFFGLLEARDTRFCILMTYLPIDKRVS